MEKELALKTKELEVQQRGRRVRSSPFLRRHPQSWGSSRTKCANLTASNLDVLRSRSSAGNKYTPAKALLEEIHGHATKKRMVIQGIDNIAFKDDVGASIELLDEADRLIATRLNLYNVYQNAYVSEPNVETVELQSYMEARADHVSSFAAKDVEFCVQLPVSLRGMLVYARLDLYMFDHIASNL